MKIIDGSDGEVDPEIAKKRKAEIEQWEKTHAEAKEKDWQIIREHAESRLKELKPATSELETAVAGNKIQPEQEKADLKNKLENLFKETQDKTNNVEESAKSWNGSGGKFTDGFKPMLESRAIA